MNSNVRSSTKLQRKEARFGFGWVGTYVRVRVLCAYVRVTAVLHVRQAYPNRRKEDVFTNVWQMKADLGSWWRDKGGMDAALRRPVISIIDNLEEAKDGGGRAQVFEPWAQSRGAGPAAISASMDVWT